MRIQVFSSKESQRTLRVGGIVLCGGESRRMGTPKTWLQFEDEYLLQRVVRTVAQSVSPIALVCRRGTALPPLSPDFPVVYDQFEDAGPLAGIAAGMTSLRCQCEAVFVSACDHPFLKAGVINKMVELLGDHVAVVPEWSGRLFPTLAVYRVTTLQLLEDLLSSGERRAGQFALQCRPLRIGPRDFAEVDPELRSFCNMNTLADYQSALTLIESPLAKGLSCER